jgi:GntR family transcriptional regulator, transcriptional repressor for pyruvate dehydrogenase complex
VQILNDLKEQIVTGALPRGAKRPTEKELSQQYAVSGPTIREAMRGLSAIGLIEVRHGSGAYVSADGGSLVAMSLGAFVQLENVGVADALAILAVLNEHAASCAVKQATSADLRRIREAAEALGQVDDPRRAAAAGRAFHHSLVLAAHNPLLEVICDFLADVQAEFALEVAAGSLDIWREMLGGLQQLRLRFVEALERRDAKAACRLAREFHAHAIERLSNESKSRDVRIRTPRIGSRMQRSASIARK